MNDYRAAKVGGCDKGAFLCDWPRCMCERQSESEHRDMNWDEIVADARKWRGSNADGPAPKEKVHEAPTPRVYAREEECEYGKCSEAHRVLHMRDLARQLERELAVAIERERLANMRADQAEEARDAAQSASEASIRADECKRIMEALDAYPPASDYGPPIKERMAELASTAKDEPACCCGGYFTETGYCPVHGALDGRNK